MDDAEHNGSSAREHWKQLGAEMREAREAAGWTSLTAWRGSVEAEKAGCFWSRSHLANVEGGNYESCSRAIVEAYDRAFAPDSDPRRLQRRWDQIARAPARDGSADEAVSDVTARSNGKRRTISRIKTVVVAATTAVIVVAIGIVALDGRSVARSDASKAPPDIRPDGTPVRLEPRASGYCQQVLPGVVSPVLATIAAAGETVGEIKTYYQPQQHRVCAKLVKPFGTSLHGKVTHLALTLCGDRNVCATDWHPYQVDAGPLVVSARDGCVSWRVSMSNRAGAWVVRDRVGQSGCS